MWDRRQGHFAIGTLNDGQTTNRTELAEDINSWSYLALEDPAYQAALHWDARALAVTAGRFAGVSYCPRDRTGVWFEGTAHLADALKLTGRPPDRKLAAGYLSDIRQAQRRGPNGDGYGIIAASRDGLSDCEGDQFFASLHTGTTAWYILAATGIDPFSLFALPRLSRPAPDRLAASWQAAMAASPRLPERAARSWPQSGKDRLIPLTAYPRWSDTL